MPRPPAPDQAQRDAAVVERARNVLIDAGAGTGKTTLLVDRLVHMVAPPGGVPAVPIDRLAAITFTRKAAGELRLKIRERLLEELGAPGVPPGREALLREALAGLDVAYVGTIHSFADRLLRLRPVEAELSPAYEIAEGDEALVRETFEVLLHAVQNGTLAAELSATPAAGRADEATLTVLFALESGILAESRDVGWATQYGLDALVAGFVGERDVPPPDAQPAEFDAEAFRRAVDAFARLARPVTGSSPGAVWIQRTARALDRLRDMRVPVLILRDLRAQLERAPRASALKRDVYAGDNVAWKVWKAFDETLSGELTAPLHRWLATRLVRLFPVVIALYEKVKTRRQALDQLDLLVKLRDLLARHRGIRGEFQRMFDHVFVDEFQDTDPLQAEIVLYLCEREPLAACWEDVRLRDGAVTLVGDPKQSIYRFRRADVATYDRVRQVIARQHPLEVRLSANFRSVPPLIGWLNDRFDRILGLSPDGHPFNPATGHVFQQRLDAGRTGAPRPAVHVLPFDFADGRKHLVNEYRTLEGRALARYLRWLVEASGVEVMDPLDGRPRPIRFGDVAVLAASTWRLPLLFPALDAEGIPYASRGGTLFLADPLHRQFLLGLRAVADRDDGVAEAALLRPPFFAVDLADLALTANAEDDETDPRVARVREARALVRELRRRRLDRPPGATARDLLEHTAFARAVALGPNGAQRLARVRELCLLLEKTAVGEGLDYDAATARLRERVIDPVQLDPPHPVGSEAVRVMTVHQAKGLEFPVVVFWDGKADWKAHLDGAAWRMERDGRGWTLNLHGLAWEEPGGLGLRDTERAYLDAERRRVVYVAATRARDLLVIPHAGTVALGKYVCADLLDAAPPALVRELEPYRDDRGATWAQETRPAVPPTPAEAADLERRAAEAWTAAAVEAARPRFRPASVSEEAGAILRHEQTQPAGRKPRVGRFGPLFGNVVHEAIGLVLYEHSLNPAEAALRVAQRRGLTEHLEEAAGDVTRALDALRAEGLFRRPGPDLQLEYPVAGAWEGGTLVSGYIDLIAVTGDRVDLIDFKTDAPPAGSLAETYPDYCAQVRAYARLATPVARNAPARCGLLLTAEGRVRWLEETALEMPPVIPVG
jgi:ATP-dependent helicase/nuclease subunit A